MNPSRRLPLPMLIVALVLVAAACGGPSETLDPQAQAGPVEATVVDGRFQLTFTLDEGIVRPDDAITGTATLRLLVPGGVDLSGSSTLFGFDVLEVGGTNRHVAPAWETICAPHRLTDNTPLASPILKSGAVSGADDTFARDYLQGAAVHLPRGAWDVTAIAMFVDGRACVGGRHELRATVRVNVRE